MHPSNNPSYCKIQVDRDGHHCDTVRLGHRNLKHPDEQEKWNLYPEVGSRKFLQNTQQNEI